jgi:hypothetical protein
LENTQDHTRRVVAFGRLALFGRGATRLHEELVAVAARCTADGLEAFGGTGERTTIEVLDNLLADAPTPHPDATLHRQVLGRCAHDFSALWATLSKHGDEARAKAEEALATRGRLEADEMTAILQRQRRRIEKRIKSEIQTGMEFGPADAEARAAYERDARFLKQRLGELDAELDTEPDAIRQGYDVVLHRFEPVGLAYLWPTS